MVGIHRVSGLKNPAEMTYYVQHNGIPLPGTSAAKVLNTVDSQTMALTLGYFVQLQAERKHSIVLASDKYANRQSTDRHTCKAKCTTHSEFRKKSWCRGEGRRKAEKDLCSLIFPKCSRHSSVCLGCSTAHFYVKREEGETELVKGEWEREHAESSYRLLPKHLNQAHCKVDQVELYAV